MRVHFSHFLWIFLPPNASPPREIHVLNQTMKWGLPSPHGQIIYNNASSTKGSLYGFPTSNMTVPPTTEPLYGFPPAITVPVPPFVTPGQNITILPGLSGGKCQPYVCPIVPTLIPIPNPANPTEIQTLQTLQKSQELQQLNAETFALKLDVISKQLSMLDDDLHNLTLALQNHTR